VALWGPFFGAVCGALLGMQLTFGPRPLLPEVQREAAGTEKRDAMKIIKNDHPYQYERLLDYDPWSGVRTYFSSDGKEGENWAIRQEFESVYPELEASKALQKDDDHWRRGVKKSWVHAAHIPDSILLKWHIDGVDINDPKELARMVSKPEWSYLNCVDKIIV
jgi:hypothetical protein